MADIQTKQLNTLARGSAYTFVARIVAVGLQFVYNLMLARYFGAHYTGLFGFGFSLINLVALIGLLGTPQTLLRFVAAYRSDGQKQRMFSLLLFAMVVGGGGALLAMILLWFSVNGIETLADKPGLGAMLAVFAPIVIPLAIITQISFALQGAKRVMESVLIREAGLSLAVLIPLFICWFFTLPFNTFVELYLVSLLVIGALAFLLLYRSLPEIRRVPPLKEWEYQPVWLASALPLALITALQSAGGWSDTIILGFLAPTNEVGVYFVAVRVSLILYTILYAVTTIFSPVAAELWHQQNLFELKQTYIATTRWTMMLTMPLALCMLVASREFMAMFGPEFYLGSTILIILVVGRLANCATGSVGRLLWMTGKERLDMVNTIIYLVATIVGISLIVPYYGAVGSALVNTFTTILINALRVWQVKRILHMHPYDSTYNSTIVASVVAGLTAWFVHTLLPVDIGALLALITVMLTVSITYVVTIFAAGLPNEDRKTLQRSYRYFASIFLRTSMRPS
jgi:O-antigen/teichoic acid export membrane protein